MSLAPHPEQARIKDAVRTLYARIATGASSCCEEASAQTLGYAGETLQEFPDDVASASAGCGNPLAHAAPQPGETVLDLGSGAGLDCFLAAAEVGSGGRVIGLDMTDAMLEKAEENRLRLGLQNVAFEKGEMEDMPIPDATVDVVISNCVINLSPNKRAVFEESFRVLRAGGRFVVSDVIRVAGRAEEISMEQWCACTAGAIREEEYLAGLRAAGFANAETLDVRPYLAPVLASATIRARKP